MYMHKVYCARRQFGSFFHMNGMNNSECFCSLSLWVPDLYYNDKIMYMADDARMCNIMMQLRTWYTLCMYITCIK